MGMTDEDLSVAGPYSPISLKKFLTIHGKSLPEFTVLIDQTDMGIAKDAENTLYITPNACKEQCDYFRDNIFFPSKRISAYLYRYLHYMFINDDYKPKYLSDQDVMNAMVKGEITATSEDYVKIQNLIAYSDANREASQIIGFIQLFAGSLSIYKKESLKTGTQLGQRIFIEEPETHLHPKRQARLMSLFNHIRDEYDFTLIKPVDEKETPPNTEQES